MVVRTLSSATFPLEGPSFSTPGRAASLRTSSSETATDQPMASRSAISTATAPRISLSGAIGGSATEMKKLAVGFLLALLLGLAPPTAAQSTSATVFGIATDEQQGVLPGVTITLQRLDTGESRTITTDTREIGRASCRERVEISVV